jgi:hypothetical protein
LNLQTLNESLASYTDFQIIEEWIGFSVVTPEKKISTGHLCLIEAYFAATGKNPTRDPKTDNDPAVRAKSRSSAQA